MALVTMLVSQGQECGTLLAIHSTAGVISMPSYISSKIELYSSMVSGCTHIESLKEGWVLP